MFLLNNLARLQASLLQTLFDFIDAVFELINLLP